MPHFGTTSAGRLATCHKDLQTVMNHAIEHGPDFSILCGHRSKEDQNKAFEEGKSQLKWPQSRHNTDPSEAVDLAPYPIDWDDQNRFRVLAGYLQGVADVLYSNGEISHRLRWGGDWDKDTRKRTSGFVTCRISSC